MFSSGWQRVEPRRFLGVSSKRKMQVVWQFGWVYRYQTITNSLSQNRSRFCHFLGTARLSASDYSREGGARILGVEEVLSRSFHPSQNNKQEGKTT